jgi:hypothetical protein
MCFGTSLHLENHKNGGSDYYRTNSSFHIKEGILTDEFSCE